MAWWDGLYRACCSWGGLVEGDQILAIAGQDVSTSTRIDCVRALKGKATHAHCAIAMGEGGGSINIITCHFEHIYEAR